MKPVDGFTAALLFASASDRSPVRLSSLNLYSFTLTTQRGLPEPSGRKRPMYTWFRNVPWVFTLTGSDADTNTLLTAWTSFRMVRSASTMSAALVAAKYLPPPTLAALFISLIMFWSVVLMAPVLALGAYTATV